MQYNLSELKKGILTRKKTIYNATMSYHQFENFENIGTEEIQIDANIKLSERINQFIQQNTYLHSLNLFSVNFSNKTYSCSYLYS